MCVRSSIGRASAFQAECSRFDSGANAYALTKITPEKSRSRYGWIGAGTSAHRRTSPSAVVSLGDQFQRLVREELGGLCADAMNEQDPLFDAFNSSENFNRAVVDAALHRKKVLAYFGKQHSII